jgi:hypothetical protein
LARASVPAASVPTLDQSWGFVEFDFSVPASVRAGTQYAIVAYTDDTSIGTAYDWYSGANVYSGGAGWTSTTPRNSSAPPPSNSWVGPASNDFAFKTYVAADTAPGAPGTPAGSPSINNTGGQTLSWSAASDGDGDSIAHYVLEHKRFDQLSFSVVSSAVSGASYAFGSGGNAAEGEGTWVYRVKAVDSQGTAGAYSPTSAAVVVDMTAPNAPTLSADTSLSQSSSYFDPGSKITWYKDSELIDVTSNGDPVNAADGSTGSGVDPASFTSPITVTTNGPSTAAQTVKDLAGNTSAAGTLPAHVDALAPTLGISCPTVPVPLGLSGAAHWTASDGESGLATPASGSVPLDTNSVGAKTANAPQASDNVGHTSNASCPYVVAYNVLGFFSPVPKQSFNPGATIPVKFALANNAGTRISNTEAQAITTNCRAKVQFASATPGCAGYSTTTQQFEFDIKTAKSTPNGSYTITLNVKASDNTTTVGNKTITVMIT